MTQPYDLNDFAHFLGNPCQPARNFMGNFDNPNEAYEQCQSALWYTWALSAGASGVRSERAHNALEQFHELLLPFVNQVLDRYQKGVMMSWLPTTFTPLETRPDWQRITGYSADELFERYLQAGAMTSDAERDGCLANLKADFYDNFHSQSGCKMEQHNSPAYVLWCLKKPYSRTWYSGIYNAVRLYLIHDAQNSVHILGAYPHRNIQEAIDVSITNYDRVMAHRFQEVVDFVHYRDLFIELITDNRRLNYA